MQPFVKLGYNISFGRTEVVNTDVDYFDELFELNKTQKVYNFDEKTLSLSNDIHESILDDINQFKNNSNMKFVNNKGSFTSSYRFYDPLVELFFNREIIVSHPHLGKMDYEDMYMPRIMNDVEIGNVACVLFYEDPDSKVVKVANITALEDARYGFPGYYQAPPGGRVDPGRSILGTALTEAYEEMGRNHVVSSGDVLEGYIQYNKTLYIFIRHLKHPSLSDNKKLVQKKYFEPSTIRVIWDKEKYWKKIDLLMNSNFETGKMDDWPNMVKKELHPYMIKMLIPRPICFNDSNKFQYTELNLKRTWMIDCEYGRYNSWHAGFPVYQGLKTILST